MNTIERVEAAIRDQHEVNYIDLLVLLQMARACKDVGYLSIRTAHSFTTAATMAPLCSENSGRNYNAARNDLLKDPDG